VHYSLTPAGQTALAAPRHTRPRATRTEGDITRTEGDIR
jgi:hypothetical protein